MAGNTFSHTPIQVEKLKRAIERLKLNPVPESVAMFEKLLRRRLCEGQIPVVWDRADDSSDL